MVAALALVSIGLVSAARADAPRINEVVTANSYSLIDSDGDRGDWIELHHAGDEA
ncbi:MAG: lamin tail domain-containing protein, partial [Puniceicoccaceae bacterium]